MYLFKLIKHKTTKKEEKKTNSYYVVNNFSLSLFRVPLYVCICQRKSLSLVNFTNSQLIKLYIKYFAQQTDDFYLGGNCLVYE